MGCELRIGKYVEGIGRGKVKLLQKRDIDGPQTSPGQYWNLGPPK